jgi:hypothetical protein
MAEKSTFREFGKDWKGVFGNILQYPSGFSG